MNELLNLLKLKIKEVIEKVYLEQPPQNTAYPYTTYNLPNTNEIDLREDFYLEVDTWGNNPDTTDLENIVDNIDKRLSRFHFTNEKISVSLYRTNRLMIEDNNPQIKHRQLRYVVQTYFL